MGVYLIAESWWSDPQNLLALAKGILGLGFVIFVHELGHFLVAKACGVKCEKFYVGFDVPIKLGPIQLPSALWKKKWGETEYGLGIIPLGGYVKMLGQDDNPAHAAAEAERIRQLKASPDGDREYTLDPRSYPAKSVPQRMAIISAGVIMNLIFAVIFGAAAYWMGVKYQPAICGQTVPGDSAWVNGLQYGDKIVQFGRDGRHNDKMRFRDLIYNIGAAHDARKMEVLIQHEEGNEEWKTLQSAVHEGENRDLPTIGLIVQSSLKLYKSQVDTWSRAGQSNIEDGDVLRQVRVGDQVLDVQDEWDLRRIMMRYADRPLTLIVDREGKSGDDSSGSQQIMLAAQPQRDLGIHMEMGPIAAIQQRSPAKASGFLVGDILLAIDGKPIEDPFLVDRLLTPFVATTVNVTVRRGNAEVVLPVTPRTPATTGTAHAAGRPQGAETIGVAYAVKDTVARVRADSPAAEAGLQSGDRITSVRFLLDETESVIGKDLFGKMKLNEPLEFDERQDTWAGFVAWSERMVPHGLAMSVTYQRGDEIKSTDLDPAQSTVFFDVDRGLIFYPRTEIRQAESLGEAWSLGVRETKEGIQQVFTTLKRFFKLYKHMGGPFSIAFAATVEASEGLPRLLTFLTLLSANLAILNFLPIPVLDGGHMMFLLYEGVFGKPMPERIAFLATMLGLCFILTLMAFVLGLDFYRFSGLGG